MAQAKTVDQGMVETGCSLTCQCWDCHSWRRHLLKVAAVVALVCGLGGEVAWQRGLWRGPSAGTPGAQAEQTLVDVPVGAEWF